MTVSGFVLVGGADCGTSCFSCFSCLEWSQLQQLLALEVAGESVLSAGAEVDVYEALEADDVTDVMEAGRLPSKTNLELVPVDMGLIRTGDRVLRKSR